MTRKYVPPHLRDRSTNSQQDADVKQTASAAKDITLNSSTTRPARSKDSQTPQKQQHRSSSSISNSDRWERSSTDASSRALNDALRALDDMTRSGPAGSTASATQDAALTGTSSPAVSKDVILQTLLNLREALTQDMQSSALVLDRVIMTSTAAVSTLPPSAMVAPSSQPHATLNESCVAVVWFRIIHHCLLDARQMLLDTKDLDRLVKSMISTIRVASGWTKADGLHVLGLLIRGRTEHLPTLWSDLVELCVGTLSEASTRVLGGIHNIPHGSSSSVPAVEVPAEYCTTVLAALSGLCYKAPIMFINTHASGIYSAVTAFMRSYVRLDRSARSVASPLLAAATDTLHAVLAERPKVHVGDTGALLELVQLCMTWDMLSTAVASSNLDSSSATATAGGVRSAATSSSTSAAAQMGPVLLRPQLALPRRLGPQSQSPAQPLNQQIRLQAHTLSPFYSGPKPAATGGGVSSSASKLNASSAGPSSAASTQSSAPSTSNVGSSSSSSTAHSAPQSNLSLAQLDLLRVYNQGHTLRSSTSARSMYSRSGAELTGESDSEIGWSDSSHSAAGRSSNSQGTAAMHASATRVRLSALKCLRTVVTATPKAFESHIGLFIPADVKAALQTQPFGGGHLMTVILYDSVYKVKIVAVQTLAAFLDTAPFSKWLGAGRAGSAAAGAASPKPNSRRTAPRSFMSLSMRYADMVRALHAGLLEALHKHTAGSPARLLRENLLMHLLPCLTVLVSTIPYRTVPSEPPGLLAPIVLRLVSAVLRPIPSLGVSAARITSGATSASSTRGLWCVRSDLITVRHATYSALSAVLDKRPPLPDIEQLLLAPPLVDPSVVDQARTNTQLVLAAIRGQQEQTASQTAQSQSQSKWRDADHTSRHESPARAQSRDDRTGPQRRLGADPAADAFQPLRLDAPVVESFIAWHGNDVIATLILLSLHRCRGEPTPDAMTVLSKVASVYPATLSRYWNWERAAEVKHDGLADSSTLSDEYLSRVFTLQHSQQQGPRASSSSSSTPAKTGDVPSADSARGPKLQISLACLLLGSLYHPDLSVRGLALKLLEEWTHPAGEFVDDREMMELNSSATVTPSTVSPFFSLTGAITIQTQHLLNVYQHARVSSATTASSAKINESKPRTQTAHDDELDAGFDGSQDSDDRDEADTENDFGWRVERKHLSLPQQQRSARVGARRSKTASRVQPADSAVPHQAALRGKVLGCLSYTPEVSWLLLKQSTQQQLLDLCLGALRDPAQSVRTAACRCVGVLGPWRSVLTGYRSFVTAAIEQCLQLLSSDDENTTVTVRIRAGWALANLCDVPSLNRQPPPASSLPQASSPVQGGIYQLASHSVVLRLIEEAIRASAGNEKVAANAVRALGNLARYFVSSSSEDHQLWARIARCLIERLQTSKTVKSQWNVCYAVGNMLKNPLLPQLAQVDNGHTLRALIEAVLDRIRSSKNCKVRINAATALTAAQSLEHVEPYIKMIIDQLTAVIEGFDDEPFISLVEYKYKDVLRIQLVAAISHLVGLCARDLSAFMQSSQGPAVVESLVQRQSLYAMVLRKVTASSGLQQPMTTKAFDVDKAIMCFAAVYDHVAKSDPSVGDLSKKFLRSAGYLFDETMTWLP